MQFIDPSGQGCSITHVKGGGGAEGEDFLERYVSFFTTSRVQDFFQP